MRIRVDRPFQGLFLLLWGLKGCVKIWKAKPITQKWSTVSHLHISWIGNEDRTTVTTALVLGDVSFLQAWPNKPQRTVCMCFHGWWRAQMFLLSKQISKTIKEGRGEFVDWYAFTITLAMVISRASGAPVFFSCVRCSAASHASGGLWAAGGSIVRKVGGERKTFFSRVPLLGAIWAQRWRLITARTEGGSY